MGRIYYQQFAVLVQSNWLGAIDVADEICIQKQQIKNEQRGELISLKRRTIDKGQKQQSPALLRGF